MRNVCRSSLDSRNKNAEKWTGGPTQEWHYELQWTTIVFNIIFCSGYN